MQWPFVCILIVIKNVANYYFLNITNLKGDPMTVKEKITMLRKLMKKHDIQIYYIPSSDYHQSEYVGDYFRCVSYMSGFTGSAGTLVVTETKAGLWSDGRYFIQAENQLKGSDIKLYKLNEPNVPTVVEFIKSEIEFSKTLGFDGRVVTSQFAEEIKDSLFSKEISLISQYDLVSEIWENRPSFPASPIFLLDLKYIGESFKSKIEQIRNRMEKDKIDIHIINTLDDIAWIYNIRGNDVKNNPVTLSYSIITMETATLYIDREKIPPKLSVYFKENNILLKNYEDIYEDIEKYENSRILLDKLKINYSLYSNIKSSNKILDKRNPSTDLKAVKNQTEIENIRESHLEDAVAMTKFMYWLKNVNIEDGNLTEYSISDKLESFRKSSKNYMMPSFDSIVAFGPNAAMMHYKPSEENSSQIKYGEFLLIDSGGQYYTGTTDITRTYALESKTKKVSSELKKHFTLVLKGMINLSKIRFLHGVTGTNLDVLARAPIWNEAIDYKCGTGHGIGFVLNVHEGPHGIRVNYNKEILNEGMIVTNEPGIYVENSHGIRIENELLIKFYKETTFGKFLEFETLTHVPIDLDAIDAQLMESSEIEFLNYYHNMVYDKLKDYLTEEERDWLKKYTKEI